MAQGDAEKQRKIELHDGADPIESFRDGDLLYGQSAYRGATQERGEEHPNYQSATKPKSIDVYNRKLGLNTLIGARTALENLFKVREALEGHGEWPLQGAADLDKPWMQDWIAKLRSNRHRIGLYDFASQAPSILAGGAASSTDSGKDGTANGAGGGGAGVAGGGQAANAGVSKINSKNRLTKNLDKKNIGHFDAHQLNAFLSLQSYAEAKHMVAMMREMDPSRWTALNQWVYKAFFRRTSKLGIDFATQELNSRVHFNVANSKDYISPKEEDRKVKPKGLMMRNEEIDHSEQRDITISELRHVKKGQRKGRLGIGKVNMYSEYKE
jgi:hypothetical protein